VVVGRRESGQDRLEVVTDAVAVAAAAPRKQTRFVSRRRFLAGSAAAVAAASARPAYAADAIESHGISAFGDLAYPATFQHFAYVNPDAPKGGIFSQIGPDQLYNQNFLTFNSLNSFILKGDAAQGMELTFATLMARSGDEPDAMYGFAAAKVRRSADGRTYTFFIRPEAKFHDGSPLTAHDVAFSLTILKEQGHPLITQSLRDLLSVRADDDSSVTVTFAPKRARDVPLFVAGLPIFSRAYYSTRKFDESTLDAPLGSGAYKVDRFDAGRYIEYGRVKDWWGVELPVARGQNNFDIVRFEFYRDRDVGFEGFTAKNYLFREEFTSRT
jgi:microcin C transport system substrate-binding protein